MRLLVVEEHLSCNYKAVLLSFVICTIREERLLCTVIFVA